MSALGPVPYRATAGEHETEDPIRIWLLGRWWDALAVYKNASTDWAELEVVGLSIRPSELGIECDWIPVEPIEVEQRDDAWHQLMRGIQLDVHNREALAHEEIEV